MSIDTPIDPVELALRDVASRIDVTDVDGFTAATMARVQRGRDDARRRNVVPFFRGGHRQLLAVAAAIILAMAAVLVVPDSRDAVGDLLGIDGLRIELDEPDPSITPPTAPSPTASADSSTTVTSVAPPTVGGDFDANAVGRAFALGSPTTLSATRTALPELRELASAYGPPDAIYLNSRPAGLVSFVWRARPGLAGSPTAPTVGLVVQQYRGTGGMDYFQKIVGGTSRVREVVVENRRGYWVDGEPHSIGYVDPSGAFVNDTVRWASNALVWANNGITYRIESSLTEAEATALVSGLR